MTFFDDDNNTRPETGGSYTTPDGGCGYVYTPAPEPKKPVSKKGWAKAKPKKNARKKA